ncbi:MAG: hypothetical protein AMJ53_01670 [Gammaproteobacteria bacterium SG8_11]|nr:MAG: hypothetical protein AMJ53_01670 [Gammaproteobacteria bacterium SG8_11]
MLLYKLRDNRFSLVMRTLMHCVVCWLLGATALYADDATERRIQISLPVFPRIVAVDNDFKKKLLPKDHVLLVFVYESSQAQAQRYAESLKQKLTNVAGLQFTAKAISVHDQLGGKAPVPTALFAAERFSEQTFTLVVEYSIKQQRILFSPFVGDVERGAAAGIAITSRIKPFFNIKTLERAEIDINAVLMNLSKRHE